MANSFSLCWHREALRRVPHCQTFEVSDVRLPSVIYKLHYILILIVIFRIIQIFSILVVLGFQEIVTNYKMIITSCLSNAITLINCHVHISFTLLVLFCICDSCSVLSAIYCFTLFINNERLQLIIPETRQRNFFLLHRADDS